MFEKSMLIGLVIATSPCAAETLTDPMRPWTQPRVESTTPQHGPRYDLSAILYSADRRVAVVNGRSVSEGDRIGPASVRRIHRDSLELEVGGKTVKLALARARPVRTRSKP